jgi:hypothetical protein
MMSLSWHDAGPAQAIRVSGPHPRPAGLRAAAGLRLRTLRMDRDAYRDDNGTDQPDTYQPDTYWRRRAVTLAAGLAVVGLLAWAFSGGGGKPAPAARNTPGSSLLPAAAYHSVSAAPSSPGADAAVPGLTSASPSATPTGSASARATRSRSSQVTPTAAASDSASASTANAAGSGGRCSPGAVVLSLFSSGSSYPAGQDPQFRLDAVSTAAGRCTFDFGPAHLHLVVMSAGRVIWDSADCARSGDTRAGTLSRGVPVQESIAWDRSITLPGCVTLASSARPGTYQAQARTAGVASQVRTFKITS